MTLKHFISHRLKRELKSELNNRVNPLTGYKSIFKQILKSGKPFCLLKIYAIISVKKISRLKQMITLMTCLMAIKISYRLIKYNLLTKLNMEKYIYI